MISLFIKEQKRYTQFELAKLFKCNMNQVTLFIKKLKQYGIVKSVRANAKQLALTDLVEEDIEIESTEVGQAEYYYVFTFVGVITSFGRVLKCYPKYIFSDLEPTAKLRTILRVLEKYNAKEEIIRMFNDIDDTKTFNLLAVMIYLLHDYYENGLYINTMDIIETNGDGEVLWDKTINETFTYLSNSKPYYMEIYTKKRVDNELDYFKRLHETVLSICSRELQQAGLIDLFGISPVEISDEELETFGDKHEILYHLKNEMNSQFDTHKQLMLKTLYTYIAQSNHLADIDNFSMFGTNGFNLVWEKICAEVMDNQLQIPVRNLPIKVQMDNTSLKLIESIEVPKWYGKDDAFILAAKDTLIPDIVTLQKIESRYRFIIFDAKYYNLILEPRQLSGQPGIGDITKQYLYQLAYQSVIQQDQISDVRNCFLMPTEKDIVIDKGRVSMNMFESLDLQSVQIRQLPAEEIYSLYLRNQKFDIGKLNL